MKRISFIKTLGAGAAAVFAGSSASAKQAGNAANLNLAEGGEFKFTLFPYIISLTESEGFIVFATNKMSVGEVELEYQNGEKLKFYASHETAGIKHAGKLHAVKISGFKAGESLKYRVSATEIKKFWTRIDKVEGRFEMGGTITAPAEKTEWLGFKVPAAGDKIKIGLVTDIHGNAGLMKGLFKAMSGIDFLVMDGDMDNWLNAHKDIVARFMGGVAEFAGGKKPVYYARGNHECRGALAEAFSKYAPFANGKTYCGFRAGPAYCLILDSCEMWNDNGRSSGGFIDLENWQKQEARWLAEEVKKPEFKSAPFRIVFQHIPIYTEDKFMHNDKGSRMNKYNTFRKKLFYDAILKDAKIDLMVNGHLHKYAWAEKVEGLNFPVFICSRTEGAVLDIDDKKILINICGADGKPVREVLRVNAKA